MPEKNLFEKHDSSAVSSQEMADLIAKARAVEDMGALGSKRVYQLVKRYFSPTVVGIENIPDRPTLFVGNHGGFGLDGFVVCPILYHEAGRFVRSMGDDIWLQSKSVGDLLINSGMIPAHPEACDAMMEDGRDLLVFPGGAHEALKPTAQKYTLQWRERYGFVRMAARHGYPITPFGLVGADDFYDHLIESDEFLDSTPGKLLKKAGVITENWREDLLPIIPRGVFSTLLPKPQHCYLAFGKPISVPLYPGKKTIPKTVLNRVRKQSAEGIDTLLRDMLLLRAQNKGNDGFIRRFLSS
ncbi:lysophospholipid acyltransferase family protein [Pseudohalioglobus lutimaris]|uniref:Acyltransferase n=1 Tax=Pseudohalioglobus lutimaris TaxID=1737061 RepID=A0A2N5WYB3_9GAMM|nr:lysophospholipid acyltransferase family protein [Pseudohalioglobus lutimaris]PLW67235.1 acyltransferase [Pseudohalioglobus lutimaris]